MAGDDELFFAENAARWASALHDAGAEVVFERREGSHGGPFWRAELPRMLRWAFASRQGPA